MQQYCLYTNEMRDCSVLPGSIFLVQVSGEHHNLTINSSDRVTIDRAARLHASASSFRSYIFMRVREQNKRTNTQTWLASPMTDAAVLVYE